ncbi:30S ribosomal protein S21, chloroplastic-like [Impatiens glandulifera]|uniref:30S ribosomal protein S21, chloroplastic-like n=1 Tax=Impatiens glandulifera TaxID=253017 RepID=UPI001FB0909F|nr:30S ribosomal protein S21, chloroplastic-like [Impatiens glandulifera]
MIRRRTKIDNHTYMAASSISNFFSLFTSLASPPVKPLLPHFSFFSPIQSSEKPDLITPLRVTHKPNYVNSMSVAFPSLANANLMFFKSGYNVQIIVRENDSEEKIVGQFKREVMKAGIIQESKRRMFFENKQDERKRRTRDAAKRNRRRRPQQRIALQDKQEEEETSKSKKKQQEDEDNWELP